MTESVEVSRRLVETDGGVVDGWVAELGGTTGVGHGREDALRQLAKNLRRMAQ